MTLTAPVASPRYSPAELAERGWREETAKLPDGTTEVLQIPLTSEEYLHPEEGYVMPNSTFHNRTIGDVEAMLLARYGDNPTVAVFRDLKTVWDNPDLKPHCPDVCVIFGVRDKDRDRSEFHVAEEGVRPSFIVEVVSPRYRKEDRDIKVEEYELAAVQEYIILDRRRVGQEYVEEIVGYALRRGRYRSLVPDDQGRILCQTVGLWMGWQEGRLVLEDATTGERLLTSQDLKALAREAQEARVAAETRSLELEARLKALETDLLRRQGGEQ